MSVSVVRVGSDMNVEQEFFIEELPNGMTLLGQRMQAVSSAAMSLSVRAGSSHDPDAAAGAAAVAGEWLFRGAGDRNTRQLHDALDALGCQHHESAQSEHICLTAAQLGQNLPEVLAIYSDVVRRPRLEDATFEPCRALIAQDLAALEDEPARKCSLLLREKFYPRPLGRCVYGTPQTLEAMRPEAIRTHVRSRLSPQGAILAVAGNFEWDRLRELAHAHFAPWPAAEPDQARTSPPEGGVSHVLKDSAQVHIALAYRSVPPSHVRYYAARVAEMILSGGMSGRLFTEVREKRGLVYHVSASYHSLKGHAGMFVYAGTRPELAQQTLDVTVGELRRLAEGVQPEEMDRARTQLKSAMVMQGESTSARSTALAGDWYHLRRLRSLREIAEAVDAVSARDVQDYLREFPAAGFAGLVIGPQPLDTSILRE